MERKDFARSVADRLSAVPGIIRPPTEDLDLFILRDFLSPPQCDALIAMIDRGRKPSRLFAQVADPEFRTSETCNLDPCDAVLREVEGKLADLTGIDPAFGEYMQGQRYDVGQRFKPHHDFLRPGQPYWDRQQQIGGQRTWTAMVYLNVPEEGGATYFPRADLKIVPRRGSIVLWNNLDADGALNPQTLHEGLPVLRGAKYIVTKWYRERPWAAQQRSRTN